jgi:hypothetical protein
MNKDNFLIYTVMLGCGEIGKFAVESFYKFHDLPLMVIGLTEDKKYIEGISDKIKFVDISNTDVYKNYHTSAVGHNGTATVWANVINQAKCDKILHFDSDVVFRGNIFDKIIELLDGFDLVGSIRNYKFNPHNREDVMPLFDVSQIYCFGYNKSKITPKDTATLKAQILGLYNPQRRPSIDFFDQVMQEIVLNGGKRYFLDNDLLGGFEYFGSKKNKYGSKNKACDYGDKIIHFASVGSGKYFYENRDKFSHINYEDHAIKKWGLFCKLMLDKELPDVYINDWLKDFNE